jgi:hypothetical protein
MQRACGGCLQQDVEDSSEETCCEEETLLAVIAQRRGFPHLLGGLPAVLLVILGMHTNQSPR